jgi:DNA-binding response OmpR family regulator
MGMDTLRIPLDHAISVDLDQQRVWRTDQFMALPARSYQILYCLLRHPNHVLPDSQLLQVGWPGEQRTSADLFPQIYRIRHAIEPDPYHPCFLRTRRSAGYLLNVDPTQVDQWPTLPPTYSA